ncbi:hypothetical protein PSPO01_04614 [Paraphaeosphaeria sporulosa]
MAGVDERHTLRGESPSRQILVICLCLLCFFVLVFQHGTYPSPQSSLLLVLTSDQGIRFGQLHGKARKSRLLEVGLYIQFLTTIAIVSSVVLLEAGLAMVTDGQCYAASVVCILLYCISKTALYMNFNEHVHSLRVPRVTRIRDPVWLTCTVCVIAGVAGSIFFAAAAPVAQLEGKTGQCNIHLTKEAIISLSTFLLAVGTYLTGTLVCILWPALKSHAVPISTRTSTYTERRMSFLSVSKDGRLQEDERSRKSNNIMLCKNLMGWTAILSIAVINMTVYLTRAEAKRSHVCLLSCVTDAALSMIITSWLVKNTAGGTLCSAQGEEVFLNRLSKLHAHQDAETKSVSNHQRTRSDSWTEYMDTLGQEKHANFNINFIEARTQTGTAWPGVLPDILEEEWTQLA